MKIEIKSVANVSTVHVYRLYYYVASLVVNFIMEGHQDHTNVR